MVEPLRIMVSRHSAFYTPLIAVVGMDFLKEEGVEGRYLVLPPGRGLQELIRSGDVDVMQTAVSSNWEAIERGEEDLAVHFAQINRRDGFFIVAREPEPEFRWKQLEGAEVLADHGRQPLAMLRHAASVSGTDWSKVKAVDSGSPEGIVRAFCDGRGRYAHLQGPGAQSAGHVVASIGEAIGDCAFSSIACSRAFLETDRARAFVRAFCNGLEWAISTPSFAVAARLGKMFPEVESSALAASVARYQELGCWSAEPEILRDHYEMSLRIFLQSGRIKRSHDYESVVAEIPGQDS